MLRRGGGGSGGATLRSGFAAAMRSASPTSSSASSAHFSARSQRWRSIARRLGVGRLERQALLQRLLRAGRVARLLSRLGELAAPTARPRRRFASSTSFARAPAARSQSSRCSVIRAIASSAPRWFGSRSRTLSYASCAAVASPSRPSCSSPSRTRRPSSVADVAAIARAIELRLEELRELRVAPRLLVELRQREHRLGVRRVLVEDGAQRLDGVVLRAELLALQLRELEPQAGALRLRASPRR